MLTTEKYQRIRNLFSWWLLPIFLFLFSFQTSSLFGVAKILAVQEGLPDYDSRSGSVPPTAAQQSLVNSMGAKVRWNSFGTPQSLIKYGGYLANGLSGDPVAAAQTWIRNNQVLFRLSNQGVDNLELLNDSKMSGYNGHAVIFRQKFGNLAATQDGMITVGITGDKIAYVSSSIAGDQPAPAAASISPTAAWIRAAADIGRTINAADIKNVKVLNGWTTFSVTNFAQTQRSRLTAFPTYTTGVRSAFETLVLNSSGGNVFAYKYFIDAQTGAVLFRQNAVQKLAQTNTFTGTYQDDPAPKVCGPLHPFNVPAGTKTIDVVATEAVIGNDIVLYLLFGSTIVATSDTATSPEAIHYEPIILPAGVYNVQVCPFNDPTVPPTPPYNYAGTFTTNDVTGTNAFPYPPKWDVFPANPELNYSSTDSRELWCWESVISGNPVPGCDLAVKNLAARAPWDHDVLLNVPTFTTKGNAANSAEAWGSPLTPSGPYRPVSSTRQYVFNWQNVWNTGKCNPASLVPQGNDIDAAVVNLFGMHNRMHDFSYYLGFTEQNFNLQDNNFGNTAPGPYPTGRERDPELGDAQAGAISGGSPSYLGRDNANQITLNDGVPPITNMYLWQPIAAAFYAPCVDGDFDMSVIGHEYTHAISNRMVGGPDSNLTGPQAGAMGESWSDLDAIEYLNAYNYVPTNGENPFSVGAYVTGNHQKGIRNYSLDNNPLNFSDIGYDVTGEEVHADGEVWNPVNIDIRQALISKYNGSFPASNATLQKECADGLRQANQCPGNRRWIQIVFDAWLLMPAAASMLDARDAYLAADLMRFGGANQTDLWRAFARRGMGHNANSNTNADGDPKPNFESPLEDEVAFKFVVKDKATNAVIPAKIFVGKFEARAVPIADTDGSTSLSDTARFNAGYTYEFLVQARGYGHVRFLRFAWPGYLGQTVTLTTLMPKNAASSANGATIVPLLTSGVQTDKLIDDTEATNWASLGQPANLSKITVKLGGGPITIKSINVSAMLRPEDASATGDDGSQNRFSALRKFKILTCSGDDLTCSSPINYLPLLTSSDAAFPGVVPRPAAPDLLIRSFTVPNVAAATATHVQLQVLTNQCTGGPGFQGDQDNDLLNNSDCVSGSSEGENVRAAELQVFGNTATVPPQDPVVAMTMSAPATAIPGSNVNYNISFTNVGPAPASNSVITDTLPPELNFVSATNGGTFDPVSRRVTWNLGTVAVGTRAVQLNTKIKPLVLPTTLIVNEAEYTADLTVATPAAAATAVLP